jgi:hypothetical protein
MNEAAPRPPLAQRRRLRLAAAALATITTLTAGAEPDLHWLDRSALDAGDVQVELLRGERPLVAEIRLAVEIEAPPESIWAVLRACDVAPEYVPNVQACRRLEELDSGRAELFVQTIKPIFFMPSFEHVFRLDYTPFTHIGVRRVSGPIELLEGSWWLLPQDGGRTLLIYELAIDPGMPVPRFMVRATLRRDLPQVLHAVRERAEAVP